jgi:hypothetical protein
VSECLKPTFLCSNLQLADVRKQLKEAGAEILVVTMLDEVAWLLNIRGGDVPHCPVAIAYAIVDDKGAKFYVEEEKVTSEVAEHLEVSTALPFAFSFSSCFTLPSFHPSSTFHCQKHRFVSFLVG